MNKHKLLNCKICNKIIEKKPNHSWKSYGNRKYCSTKCRDQAKRFIPLPKIECAWCGKKFTPLTASTQFCSIKCARKLPVLRHSRKKINLNKVQDPRIRKIITYRFGIDTKPHSLAETGKRFKLTKERIRQLINKYI